jgi:hypothetical protein
MNSKHNSAPSCLSMIFDTRVMECLGLHTSNTCDRFTDPNILSHTLILCLNETAPIKIFVYLFHLEGTVQLR